MTQNYSLFVCFSLGENKEFAQNPWTILTLTENGTHDQHQTERIKSGRYKPRKFYPAELMPEKETFFGLIIIIKDTDQLSSRVLTARERARLLV